VKYFKEKRVMEYNRDKTIERIKKEDAAMAAAQRGASGQ
jgi:cytochrome c oxidase assembly factor 6